MRHKRANRDNKKIKKPARTLLDEEILLLKKQYEEISNDTDKLGKFTDFPLSQKTQKALAECKYIQPTDIQRASILPALLGKDVLGAAITGSGKTLAFLIPVLEHLFVNKWSRSDGVCAIIISPTRELAYQIFETLKKVGKYHDFSAGLIIGGKNLKFERQRMDQCNILICTPGRLLQHMDENPLFQANTMEMLVLDEADRCLDMGFEQTLNAIIENFPPQRQTLLFSATQTRSVKDLARLNLQQPIYIGFGEHLNQGQNRPKDDEKPKALPLVVPELLRQSYVVVKLEDKFTVLWSFIKNHLKQKILIFLASCKQVKYFHEILSKLHPGTSVLALYGTLHQDRRLAIYEEFSRKNNVVMLATDIASRGLDFPSINWVIQLDCPEDVNQYIHRAGRSARNKTHGESLLVLMPTEEENMLEELQRKFIQIQKISIDSRKLFSPLAKIQGFLAQNQELKASAQRAFISYIKSVFLMKNKKIFNVRSLDFDAYAMSLGLVVTPRVRFLERFLKKSTSINDNDNPQDNKINIKQEEETDDKEHIVRKEEKKHLVEKVKKKKMSKSSEISDDTNGKADEEEKKVKREPIFAAFHDVLAESEDGDEDFFTLKRANHSLPTVAGENEEEDIDLDMLPKPEPRKKKEKLLTKAALAKRALKKKLNVNTKMQFDETGSEIKDQRKHLQSELAQKFVNSNDDSANDDGGNKDSKGGINIELSKRLLLEEDKYDKERFRQLVKQRHKKLKKKLKERPNDSESDDQALASASDIDNLTDRDDDGQDVDSVDLSWLPNPSKVYKVKGDMPEEEIMSHNEASSNDSSDEDSAKPLRKKLKITSKLSLTDAEIIAAQLLTNSLQ